MSTHEDHHPAHAPVPQAGAPTVPADESAELLDLLHRLLRDVRRAAVGAVGPGAQAPGQVRMLRVLQHCDGPLRLGQVATALDVAPRSVTSKVDTAEADGLVRRVADPTDRRATLIELTEAGRALLDDVSARRHEGVAGRLDRLDADERAQLLALLRRLTDPPATA
ncbi:MarR family transcriptional regulator [Cellulomonas fimi]|uniref:Regulatory protein MarR n=1 Tax=Cellulomonas fimi (strain ATCC 484 / DSM 20113 / JCM 1341 / CCUG 24087 / LMG 16345 / NBRC 15513 / NCIMB 8980 / NCTC 7547 / NRS-133) TaxID=590998 RepID=F4H6V8_CELFA|nr:MarR family transcriptional regulator [Cellulomonas fimi]AEE44467.1 regulatory protein MarR [Cellulomonas fimi ATCC 484]NNH06634.1 MarR family transcriptional regulator [Cellulomonas fimi]VEH26418.1 DNA-binding transcriptional repressor MarR [Cellulomonas fimi]